MMCETDQELFDRLRVIPLCDMTDFQFTLIKILSRKHSRGELT